MTEHENAVRLTEAESGRLIGLIAGVTLDACDEEELRTLRVLLRKLPGDLKTKRELRRRIWRLLEGRKS